MMIKMFDQLMRTTSRDSKSEGRSRIDPRAFIEKITPKALLDFKSINGKKPVYLVITKSGRKNSFGYRWNLK